MGKCLKFPLVDETRGFFLPFHKPLMKQQLTDDADDIPVTGPNLFFPKGHAWVQGLQDQMWWI